jgi:hypothetical protein
VSADNWAICPKCLAKAVAEKEAARKRADDAYGKLPAVEWRKLADEAAREIGPNTSLREDYWFSMGEGGQFEAKYRGDCQDCDFVFEFMEKRQAWRPTA